MNGGVSCRIHPVVLRVPSATGRIINTSKNFINPLIQYQTLVDL